MEIELSDYSRYNKELLREREQQKLKLEATTREITKKRQQVRKYFKIIMLILKIINNFAFIVKCKKVGMEKK